MPPTNILTPLAAAHAADAVYGIRQTDDAPRAFKNTVLKDQFVFGKDSRSVGNSGLFRSQSGFGIIARGTDDRPGEVLIATRGTVTAADWFNNALALSSLSSDNKRVHRGFNQIFQSFKGELSGKLKALAPTRVHCVGHSLGGALAHLIAEWVEHEQICDSHLYTFGSPRVGMDEFSKSLTMKVGTDRIHRAYHKTDIVPMVPIWPFVHSPSPGIPCFIDSPGDFPGAKYHERGLYISSMRQHKDWTTLRKRPPKTDFEKQIEQWLESDSPLSLTGGTIAMINSALIYVIKKLALAGIQFAVAGFVNMIDALAALLARGWQVIKEVSGLIRNLIRRILSAIGKVVVEVKNLTYQFLKWVLESLALAMLRAAKLAIQLTHRVI